MPYTPGTFSDRWQAVVDAINAGELDPQNSNFHPLAFSSAAPPVQAPPANPFPPAFNRLAANDPSPFGPAVSSYAPNNQRKEGPMAAPQAPQPYDQPPTPSTFDLFNQQGPGVLFGGNGNPNWTESLGSAFDRLRDDPKWLSERLKNRDQFSVVHGADGSMYRVNTKSGAIEQLTGATAKNKYGFLNTPEGTYRTREDTGEFTAVGEPRADPVKIGTGPFGDIMGVRRGSRIFDENNKEVFASPGVEAAASDASGSSPASTGWNGRGYPKGWDNDLEGPARLDQIRNLLGKEYARDIEQYINGEKMPTSKGDNYTKFVRREAALIDPNANDLNFASQRKALTELQRPSAGGYGGQAMSSTAAIKHIAALKKSYDDLGNGDLAGSFLGSVPGMGPAIQLGNSVRNTAPDRADKEAAVNLNKSRVAEETTKFISGGVPAQQERNRINKVYATDLPPSVSDSVMQKEKALLNDRFEAMMGQIEASGLRPTHPALVKMRKEHEEALKLFDDTFANSRTNNFKNRYEGSTFDIDNYLKEKFPNQKR